MHVVRNYNCNALQLHEVKALDFAPLLATYPTLSAHYKVIKEHPRLKSYLATRPSGP